MLFIILLQALILVVAGCTNTKNKQEEAWYIAARKEMVQDQIIARGIHDARVIDALLTVERHKFVPKQVEALAYNDYPLPIGEDQTISQPYIVALMTEKLHVKRSDKVLEIGTGSGYQAAILSLLAREVYTIEIIPSLAQSATQRLQELGFRNVHVRSGDGFLGWPDNAPFDAIIITCAPPQVPQPLIEQLADGGRLIVPLGEDFQMLTLFTKIRDTLQKTEIIPVMFVPMKGMIEER